MSYSKEFFKKLKNEKTNYIDMINFCCDSLILNNGIIQELAKNGLYFENFCGEECYYIDNDDNEITSEQAAKMELEEYNEIYYDIYQYFIIDKRGAELLAEYTNEIVFYNSDLDLYILGVTHFGSSWAIVPSNWKELNEVGEDD